MSDYIIGKLYNLKKDDQFIIFYNLKGTESYVYTILNNNFRPVIFLGFKVINESIKINYPTEYYKILFKDKIVLLGLYEKLEEINEL